MTRMVGDREAVAKRKKVRRGIVQNALRFLERHQVICQCLPALPGNFDGVRGIATVVTATDRTRRESYILHLNDRASEDSFTNYPEVPLITVDLRGESSRQWGFVLAQILGVLVFTHLRNEGKISDFRAFPRSVRLAGGIAAVFTITFPFAKGVRQEEKIRVREISIVWPDKPGAGGSIIAGGAVIRNNSDSVVWIQKGEDGFGKDTFSELVSRCESALV